MSASRGGAPMSCDDAASILVLGSDDASVARATQHRNACSRCGVGADDRLPRSLVEALPTAPRWLTAVLLVLGAAQAAMAIPWLVASDPFGFLGSSAPATHTVRDGAVGLAVGAAAVMVGVRPRWARPAFFIASLVVMAQGIAGVVDSSIAETGPPEFVHLLGVLLTLLLGATAGSQLVRPMGPARSAGLRSVGPGD